MGHDRLIILFHQEFLKSQLDLGLYCHVILKLPGISSL